MKQKFLLLALLALSFEAFAQQDALYSQYYFNPLVINPAYAGSRETMSFLGVHRSQFLGIEGAYNTQQLAGHSLVRKGKIGLGGQLFQDRGGPMRTLGILSNYAYRIRFGYSSLAIGIQAGVFQYRLDNSLFNPENTNDNAIFTTSQMNRIVPDAGFGLYHSSANHYIGLSVSHLLESRLIESPVGGQNASYLFRHYFFTAGIVRPVSDKVKFKPSILLKYVQGAPVNADVNASFLFVDKVWAGVGWRTSTKVNGNGLDNTLLTVIQYQINDKLRAGYAFDLGLNQLASYNNGSHELMVGVDLNLTKGEPVTPRNF